MGENVTLPSIGGTTRRHVKGYFIAWATVREISKQLSLEPTKVKPEPARLKNAEVTQKHTATINLSSHARDVGTK